MNNKNKFNEYVERYARIHDGVDPVLSADSGPTYSAGGKLAKDKRTYFDGAQFVKRFPPLLQKIIDKKQRAISILDYGCGQAVHVYRGVVETHRQAFHAYFDGMIQSYYCYDPAVKKYSVKPTDGSLFDVVCCSDVMEHVPEEYVGDVLSEINHYTKIDGAVLFTISGVPAKNSFMHGENLHVTVKPFEWWKEKFDRNINKTYALYFKAMWQEVNPVRYSPFEILEPEKYTKGTREQLVNTDKFVVW